jgi:hypothetical protein
MGGEHTQKGGGTKMTQVLPGGPPRGVRVKGGVRGGYIVQGRGYAKGTGPAAGLTGGGKRPAPKVGKGTRFGGGGGGVKTRKIGKKGR